MLGKKGNTSSRSQLSVISSISQAAEEITDVNSIYLIAFCALLFAREIISNLKFFK